MNEGLSFSRMAAPFRTVTVMAVVGLALSACALGVGGPAAGGGDGQASGATATSDGGAATPTAAGVLGTWEGDVLNGKLRIDINEVLVSEGMTRLTFTVTNTGPTELDDDWKNQFRGNSNSVVEGLSRFLRDGIQLIDMKNHLVYEPGRANEGDYECLCTADDTIGALKSGESIELFTTFKALPEEMDTVAVNIIGTRQIFENLKVTRK
ncbi:MAG: hypothetical protein Q4C87_12400 [Actinomycetaceae bacterium]|nr:hypothetical protein [Actinomycetaceae bacterium]